MKHGYTVYMCTYIFKMPSYWIDPLFKKVIRTPHPFPPPPLPPKQQQAYILAKTHIGSFLVLNGGFSQY